MSQTTPFTAAELVDIRRYAGFGAKAAYGYTLTDGAGLATLDTQCAGMSDPEQAVVRTRYLPVLATLETAITDAGANLDTDVAAVWTRNRSEVSDRIALFNTKRREFCGFIGVKPGPGLSGGGTVVRC